MSAKKRIISLFMAVVFLCTFVLSSLFIVENSHHDCTGEHCQVCSMLQVANHNLTGNKLEPNIFDFALLFVAMFLTLIIIGSENKKSSDSLIDLHIKLSM